MVELIKISDHEKTSSGSACTTGKIIGRTQIGWSQWVIVSGEGSKRTSRTLHCDEKTALYEKGLLKGKNE